MVRVFFEKDGYAELVAVFMDESTYIDCLPALERKGKDYGYSNIIECVEDSVASGRIEDVLNENDYLPLIKL